MLADQMIPVGDGASMASDVHRPKKPGRYPVVVVFAAYTKELHRAGFPAGTNKVCIRLSSPTGLRPKRREKLPEANSYR
jgi:predicted acyl esterase